MCPKLFHLSLCTLNNQHVYLSGQRTGSFQEMVASHLAVEGGVLSDRVVELERGWQGEF